MKDLIIYSIACYSLTFGFIESPNELIVSLREIIKDDFSEKLIKCYHCSGFWIGLLLSPYLIYQFDTSFIWCFVYALYGAGMCYLLHILEDYIYFLRHGED